MSYAKELLEKEIHNRLIDNPKSAIESISFQKMVLELNDPEAYIEIEKQVKKYRFK